jgi:hypothetical protein
MLACIFNNNVYIPKEANITINIIAAISSGGKFTSTIAKMENKLLQSQQKVTGKCQYFFLLLK